MTDGLTKSQGGTRSSCCINNFGYNYIANVYRWKNILAERNKYYIMKKGTNAMYCLIIDVILILYLQLAHIKTYTEIGYVN